jgi:hypothetical protein
MAGCRNNFDVISEIRLNFSGQSDRLTMMTDPDPRSVRFRLSSQGGQFSGKQYDTVRGRGNFDEGYPSDYLANSPQTLGSAPFSPSGAFDARGAIPRRAHAISSTAPTTSHTKKGRRGAYREHNGFSAKWQRQAPVKVRSAENCTNTPIIEDWRPEM